MTTRTPDLWLEDNDVQIRYRTFATTPPTLVLGHELGGDLESWDDLLCALKDQYSIVRYDQRGHGQSEKVRACPTLADQVADLRAVLSAAAHAGPHYFVGLAAGSQAGVACELAYPGTFAGLILCAPALVCTPAQAAYLTERATAATEGGMRAVADTSLTRSYPPRYRDATRFAHYRRRLLANDPWCYANANLVASRNDIASALAQIDCPVLLIAGDDDLVRPPEHVEDVAQQFRHASYRQIPAGHLMSLHAPDHLAVEITQFVSRVSAQTRADMRIGHS